MGRDTKLLLLLVASMFLLTLVVLSSFPSSSPISFNPVANVTTTFENVKLVLEIAKLILVIIIDVIGILLAFRFLYRHSDEELSYIQKFGIEKDS